MATKKKATKKKLSLDDVMARLAQLEEENAALKAGKPNESFVRLDSVTPDMSAALSSDPAPRMDNVPTPKLPADAAAVRAELAERVGANMKERQELRRVTELLDILDPMAPSSTENIQALLSRRSEKQGHRGSYLPCNLRAAATDKEIDQALEAEHRTVEGALALLRKAHAI